ncbi:MAG: hypothetical protein A2504_13460 [Bdellovibrionales bacterium RIFOXYD12_FULL_39_22]|nr:MAG: hypothetical protein A2385_01260 [Bdellovibrionales bacterium RIFOXYB1_FULL_39_21]OFZ43634.1 MAG: hypothetical protein A2485_12930 [Bdellovibrionales bacterium RIFOXYC12_FULL_39_17]OFZ44653.1 MAG: hypothetical protein A2404_10620 [Bdellovibrionales bacterium RIFOXYC1_FULL_39_130]OFZ73056.1 MAG: hypothetical protein A2451_16105 [Bdellovibrionales bacterium RIFOXYC2_FULL_39_8]OFZ76412.1 MAG: hypothetical protein A2560_07240 [Bdellovibrionales bacterium RIFOXYD1_FULL_39_84]OFZ94678.1 MAG:
MLGLKKNKILPIEIETQDLTPSQIRLIKSLNSMLLHVITTDEESEFFEGSAEFMRMCAALIKQARFAEHLKGVDDIPYAEQALEYSMDLLQENFLKSKIINYDN